MASKSTPSRSLFALGVCVWATAIVIARGSAPQPTRGTAPGRVDYQRQVQPILAERCLECHSQDKRKGGLSLATYADVLEGGKDGPVVRPGNSPNSLIVQRLTGSVEPRMPKDELPLDGGEIAIVRAWIDQGARATPAGPAAPAPWEAPLALDRPAIPAATWTGWNSPMDRFVSAYLVRRGTTPATVSDALFARRAYLDVWGLLPTPQQLRAFVADTAANKRQTLVATLLADSEKYADHWISFWNDLLRNEDGVTYFSETAGRKSITDWLHQSLRSNLPYDRFVSALLNPTLPTDPEGFLVGVNWRGETSAAVTPWMQASQNTAQIFLGINLKCTSCHDSFVNRWKLGDAYGLAAYFAPEPRLRLYRCDVAQDAYAEPRFLFPELTRAPRSSALADRRAAVAEIFTDPRIGRMPRTMVNRVWQRLFGQGIVANPDEMDGEPWSPVLLDWLAADFVEHKYDLKHLIETILTSRAYQMPSVSRQGEPPARGYAFAGPEVRRLSAEQFADAIGAITGEWNVAPIRNAAPAPAATLIPQSRAAGAPSQPTTSGMYAREWRVASSNLTRALGRPIRDQIVSTRPASATTLQALELTNGELLARWLSRGARRMIGELPPEPASLYNRAVSGRNAAPSTFTVDVSRSSKLWLVVQETGSNVPEAIEPAWAQAELTGPDGSPTRLSSLTPIDSSGVRPGEGPIRVPGTSGDGVRVKNPSVLVYDIAGMGFTSFRGVMGLENRTSDIGSTLNPSTRFFVFDVEPDMERLIPPVPGAPLPPASPATTIAEAVDRIFRHALGRPPSAAERKIAEAALRDPARPGRPSPTGVADVIWAVLMKPEFQLIY